jgi:hypothetical protein
MLFCTVALEVSRSFVENKDGTYSLQTQPLLEGPDQQFTKVSTSY